MPRPPVSVLALLGTALLVVPASATMLGGDSGRLLGVGQTRVTECDDAQTVEYLTAGGQVTAVKIGGIADPECSGERLSVTLTATGVGVASGGPVRVPSDADSDDDEVTVNVGPGASAAQVDRVDVLIEDAS
ncbi:MAG TPA: hypothetical protein VN238_17840 [Solirubrobacteraceae bacterium]|nr:hypothetical protein [Solirubrobacteraceae bacterium]